MGTSIQHFIAGMAHVPPIAIYAFVVVWLAAESCGLPLPNELVLLFAGSLASQHIVSPIALVLLATAASVGGAAAAYEIGRRGGRVAVLRVGRYIRLDESRLDAVERWFRSTGPVAIGLSRITPFVRTVASFPAGMLALPLPTFLVAALVGSLVWCTVMVTIGDLLGANYVVALQLIQRYTIPAIIVVVVLFAGYLWLHNRLSHIGAARGSTTDAAEVPEKQHTSPTPPTTD
jgi:membrane protein DedA with SNARE-associated domain